MICEKCNAEILDNSKFCTNCGAEVTKDSNTIGEEIKDTKVVSAKEKVEKQTKSMADNIGIVVGTCIIIVGFVFFCTEVPIYRTSFGADFYTYTYKGIVAVAELLVILIKVMSCLLMAIGAFMDCYFISKKKHNKIG